MELKCKDGRTRQSPWLNSRAIAELPGCNSSREPWRPWQTSAFLCSLCCGMLCEVGYIEYIWIPERYWQVDIRLDVSNSALLYNYGKKLPLNIFETFELLIQYSDHCMALYGSSGLHWQRPPQIPCTQLTGKVSHMQQTLGDFRGFETCNMLKPSRADLYS